MHSLLEAAALSLRNAQRVIELEIMRRSFQGALRQQNAGIVVPKVGAENGFFSVKRCGQRVVADPDADLLQRFLQQTVNEEIGNVNVVGIAALRPQFDCLYQVLAGILPVPVVKLQYRRESDVPLGQVGVKTNGFQR